MRFHCTIERRILNERNVFWWQFPCDRTSRDAFLFRQITVICNIGRAANRMRADSHGPQTLLTPPLQTQRLFSEMKTDICRIDNGLIPSIERVKFRMHMAQPKCLPRSRSPRTRMAGVWTRSISTGRSPTLGSAVSSATRVGEQHRCRSRRPGGRLRVLLVEP
jgi:hypothetical protein